jgi:hypothetical protein
MEILSNPEDNPTDFFRSRPFSASFPPPAQKFHTKLAL